MSSLACVGVLLGKKQECYDDAITSADENGIIHADRCKEPVSMGRPQNQQPPSTEHSTTGSDKGSGEVSAQISKRNPSVVGNPSVSPARVATTTRGASNASGLLGLDPSSVTAMQHNFLGVFAEMCEIARPKIAAEAVMTSACKVG